MATIKQIEANRLNARKSTGPRSVEGKAVSRMNALKTGIDAEAEIIRGEDPAGLEALTAEYLERFQPAGPEERACVATMIRADWQLRRLARVDAQLWAYGFEASTVKDEIRMGHVFFQRSDAFFHLQRRIDSTERSYQRALRELQRLRASAQIGFVPPPEPVATDGPAATPFPNSSPIPSYTSSPSTPVGQDFILPAGFQPTDPRRTPAPDPDPTIS